MTNQTVVGVDRLRPSVFVVILSGCRFRRIRPPVPVQLGQRHGEFGHLFG